MATSAMAGVSCLQVGPRQGVYCRPSVVLTAMPGGGYQQQYMSTGGGRLKWRLSQFKSPEHNYRLRARADTEENPPENIPQIAGRIIERPSSAASQQRATPKLPPKITKSHSSCNLNHNTPYSSPLDPRIQPQQQATAGPGKFLRTSSGPIIHERHRKSSTAPAFSIQACSVTIQSRPLARSLTAPPKKIAPPDEPFPYPDPVLVGGDHAFNIRLVEMAGLQRETVKLEEWRVRIARRNAAASTAGATASTQNSTVSSSLQSNNPHQPGGRSSSGGANAAAQSVRPSSGVTRVSSRTGLSRKTSLPAGYTATAVQPPPPLPPPSSLPGLSQTTKDSPVVKRTSSPLSSISECKRSANSDASVNKTPEKMAADKTGQKTDNSFREKDTVQKETVENGGAIEGSGSNDNEGIEEMGAVEIKEVVPSSHHRDLVEAIFSQTPKQKQSPNVESCTQPTCGAGVSGVDSDSNCKPRKVEPSTTGRSTHTRPSSARPNTPKSKTTTLHTPSPTKPLQETLSPSTPVSPTSKASPPSSASSSSITSEHSPRPASGSSGKKPHKSSRNRKNHKKSHGRHKNT